MRQKRTLKTKLLLIGSALLFMALASIGLTLWVTWQLEGGAAAVNEAGRMRMQTWQLASAVQAETSPAELAELVKRFDASIDLLREGDPARPLFVPWSDEVEEQFAVVAALWATQREQWLAQPSMGGPRALQAAQDYAASIDGLVRRVEGQLSRLTAILNLFQFGMMALAIGGAVVMVYTGYLYVINPLGRLRQGLAEVQAGHLKTRIEVDTEDEFGQVAEGFNRMAQTLDSLYEGLEAQVQQKTQRVEAQRARLEALYEVSAFLGAASSMDEMARGFAQRVRAVMRAEALTVRWSDEGSQRYLMLASDNFPEEIQEEERCLLAGACACGHSHEDSRIRVIPIIQHDLAPMRHCSKVGYETLITVPIRLQQRVLGEFNLFYRSALTLTEEERSLLDALASHLASALEGLRAAALEREAAVGEERALIARELHDSIAQSLAFMKIQVQLLRAAQQGQDPTQAARVIDEMEAGLKESIGDVRELLVHFRTRTNQDDMEPALQSTLQKFEHQTGLSTELDVRGEGLPLLPDVQVQVLHVVQEALSNVRKHAQAAKVVVSVRKGPQWIFMVRDDGSGFDPDEERADTHVGMSIMRERADRIGAQVAVVSEPGEGTTVILTLPPHPEMASSVSHNPSGRTGAVELT